MMVCAAAMSIGSVPTNALDQEELEQIFPLTFPGQAAVYAVAFGYEDPNRGRDHYSEERIAQLKAVLSEVRR